jgi:hypothetical protein
MLFQLYNFNSKPDFPHNNSHDVKISVRLFKLNYFQKKFLSCVATSSSFHAFITLWCIFKELTSQTEPSQNKVLS